MNQILKIMVIGAGTRFDIVNGCLDKHKVYPVFAEKSYYNFHGVKYDDNSLFNLSISENIDLVVVAGLNRKLAKCWTTINSIVLHGGRVPQYRGASVLNWQILNEEQEIYLSILKLSEMYDEGNILIEKSISNDFISLDQVRDEIDRLFAEMVLEIVSTRQFLGPGVEQIGVEKTWEKRYPENGFFEIKNCSIRDINLLFKASELTYRPYFKLEDVYYRLTHIDCASVKDFAKNNDTICRYKDKYYLIKNNVGYLVKIERLKRN